MQRNRVFFSPAPSPCPFLPLPSSAPSHAGRGGRRPVQERALLRPHRDHFEQQLVVLPVEAAIARLLLLTNSISNDLVTIESVRMLSRRCIVVLIACSV